MTAQVDVPRWVGRTRFALQIDDYARLVRADRDQRRRSSHAGIVLRVQRHLDGLPGTLLRQDDVAAERQVEHGRQDARRRNASVTRGWREEAGVRSRRSGRGSNHWGIGVAATAVQRPLCLFARQVDAASRHVAALTLQETERRGATGLLEEGWPNRVVAVALADALCAPA